MHDVQVVDDCNHRKSHENQIDPEQEVSEAWFFKIGGLQEVLLPNDICILHCEAHQNQITEPTRCYRDYVLVSDGWDNEDDGVNEVSAVSLFS